MDSQTLSYYLYERFLIQFEEGKRQFMEQQRLEQERLMQEEQERQQREKAVLEANRGKPGNRAARSRARYHRLGLDKRDRVTVPENIPRGRVSTSNGAGGVEEGDL